MKLFLLSILNLHGWTYNSTQIFVTCHVKEIQYKNSKTVPIHPSLQYNNNNNVPFLLAHLSRRLKWAHARNYSIALPQGKAVQR